ncbi:hypothetical protein Tco_0390376 [Tanacetum coccineum]
MLWRLIKIVRWLINCNSRLPLRCVVCLEDGLNLLIYSSSNNIEGDMLSNMEDRCVWDLNEESVFRVKDVRILLDEWRLTVAELATDIVSLIMPRRRSIMGHPLVHYAVGLIFKSIREALKLRVAGRSSLYKLGGLWMFRNQLLFSSKAPRKDFIFDDIVSRSFTWCLSRCNCTFS